MSKKPDSKRPTDWTAKDKLRAVIETAALGEEDLGTYLRTHGLHEEQLTVWRQEAEAGLDANRPMTAQERRDAKRVRELEKKLARTEKKLGAAEAIVELQKKVQELWGDAGEDTPERSGKK